MRFDVSLTVDIDSTSKVKKDREWEVRMFLALMAYPGIYKQILKTSTIKDLRINSVEEREE